MRTLGIFAVIARLSPIQVVTHAFQQDGRILVAVVGQAGVRHRLPSQVGDHPVPGRLQLPALPDIQNGVVDALRGADDAPVRIRRPAIAVGRTPVHEIPGEIEPAGIIGTVQHIHDLIRVIDP